MKGYSFHAGPLERAHAYSFSCALFNRADFLNLKSSAPHHSFYVIDDSRLQIAGHVHFHVDEYIARSPLVAPFGSFEFDRHVPDVVMVEFVQFVEQELQKRKLKRVILKCPPEGYCTKVYTLLQVLLLNLGYSITEAEVGSVIDLRSIETWDEIVHPRKRRKLHQSQLVEGFDFRELDHAHLKDVYHFIAKLRETKAYRLSISVEELDKTFRALPGDYKLFGVFHGNKMVAASVGVRVTDRIFYHFISDYHREEGKVKPGLLLMDGIVRYCKSHLFEVLDLGTSATDGMPNFSLIDFKLELGGSLTSKFTFEKQLSE